MTTDYTLEIFEPGDARVRMRQASEAIGKRIDEYRKAATIAAEAESVYRIEIADAMKRYRKEGMAVEEAKITAQAEVAVHEVARNETAAEAKAAAEKITAALDARRSLWRLVEWSMRVATAAGVDDRVPA